MGDSKSSKSKDKNQHIQVFVRVRPVNNIEKNCKSYSVVETGNKEVIVKERPVEKITKTFTFDKVFGPESKQIDVYKAVVNPLIEEVLAGYNCTVFAYGQTGTGKTFTMEGERVSDPSVSWDNDPLSGIIPRTLSHLFDELRTLQAEYTVRVSFLELYNEELFDLLSPTDDTSKIKLFEDSNKKGSVIISGLEEVTVHNKNEVYKIMEMGSIKRQTAATLMNAQSSRSHTVFSITVHIKDNNVDGEELLKTGKLNLVDLAGSENVGRSGAVDKRAREAGNINQSLLTLGRCITSLVERAPHIPYRESKLTRLLQDSLGGRTKTSIIATISPAACNLEETLSTLDYAHRAKNITNRPEINQKLTKKALLKEYTEEIERLRRDMQAARDKNGIYLANENYTEMVLRLEHQEQEIISKLANIKALTEDMEKKEALCQELNISLEQRTEELQLTTQVLEQTRSTLTHTENKLKDTQQERDEEHHLLEHHVVTEKKLDLHARQLLTVADQSSTDSYRLHDKLDRKRSVENTNNQISRDFRIAFQQKLVHMEENVGLFTQEQLKFWADLQNKFAVHLEKGSSGLSQVSEHMSSLVNSLNQLIQDFQKQTSDQAYSSQQWIQEHLGTARSRSDSQESSLHQFQTELMPIMQGLARQLQSVQGDIQELKRNVMQELPYMVDMIVEHEAKETARLNQLRETTLQLVQQHQINMEHSQALMASLKQVKDVHSDGVIEALTKALEQIKSGKANTNQILTELSSTHSQATENSKHVAETVTDGLHREIKYVNELRTSYETHSNELRDNLVSTFEHSSSALTDANRFQTDLERGVNAVLLSSEQVLKEDYTWVEKDLRKHSESINGQLRLQQDSVQGLLGVVHTSADVHETSLEHQRAELAAFVRNGQSDLELHCSYVNDWSHQNTVELRQRDQDLDKFLSEDLCKDAPTGTTPQRRDYKYERDLVATSPHERILARYRERHNRAMAEQAKHDSSSETFVSIEDAEQISPPSDNSDDQFLEATVPKAASTNDLLSLDKVDLDSSFSSEPGFVKRENKENKNNLSVPPSRIKKHHPSIGVSVKKSSRSNGDFKVPSRKVLSAQNQH